MDEATRAEVDAWLGRARRDLDSARRLLAGDPPYRDTAAYHCQQAAEKAIKGLLTAAAIDFPKTHDLTVLIGLAERRLPRLAECREAAIVLTPYATLFRYPGAPAEPSDDDLREAVSLAQGLLSTVLQELNSLGY
jgi:HEPN domain-containing protein